MIAVLNIYPMRISRNLIIFAKEESIPPYARQVADLLGELPALTPESVEQVLETWEADSLSRVVIFDLNKDELCARGNDAPGYDERVLFSMAEKALSEGEADFRSSLTDGAFLTYACAPVESGGQAAAAVGVYEYDDAAGALVMGIRDDMLKAALGFGAAAVIVSLLLSRTLSAGLTRVLTGIRKVREGDYTFRAQVRGHDEFATLTEEFNTLTERMQQTEERRRRFVSDASHELKTPLSAIMLLADTILESDNMDAGTMREFVTGIREEAQRLGRTTSQLLDLTKLDRPVEEKRVDVDCVAVAKRVLSALDPIARKAGVAVTARFDANCHVLATEDDLFHLLHNLVDNAIKYNTENGRVTVSVLRDGGDVVITVEDTGIGIPEEDLPYIFDRFYRVEKSRDRGEGGTGLGLSIVRSTADRHGGVLSVRPVSPHGTAFTVTFPGTMPE